MGRSYWVKVEVDEVKHETEDAILIETVFAGDEDVWIPKSQIRDKEHPEKGQSGEIFIPRWMAEDKELEYEEE